MRRVYLKAKEAEKEMQEARESKEFTGKNEKLLIENLVKTAKNNSRIGDKLLMVIDPMEIHIPEWQRRIKLERAYSIGNNYNSYKWDEPKVLLYKGILLCIDGQHAGLYECVKFMTGHSHSDEGVGEEFGLKVMQALNDKCNQWKEEENIDYSLYGTPLESTTYKFAKSLKNRFGKDVFVKIDGKDRNYITNSYHIPVFEPITAFEKLRIESKFQKLSPGGAISYIEIPSMTHNIPAILEVIKFIYNNIMYAEINTKNCYCEKCGFDGDIPLVKDEDGILKWKCPNCGNTDNTTMDIAFRVCGYIGTAKNGGNQGRYGDIHDRVYHLDDTEYEE